MDARYGPAQRGRGFASGGTNPNLVRTVLRPLGIGEMLDRAVTLSVRYFVPLGLIWVVFVVPLTILQYYGTADMSKFLDSFTAAANAYSLSKSPAAQRAALDAMNASSVFNGFTIGYFVLLLLVQPLAGAALKRTCSDVYLSSRAPSVRTAYRDALKQWLPLVLIVLIWLALGLVAYLVTILAAIPVGLAVGLIFYVSKALGIAVAAALAIIFLAALAVAGVLVLLSVQVAFYTQIIESPGFIRSFVRGITRVFGSSFKRSIGVGFALGAVDIGFLLLSVLGQALLFGIARSHVLGALFTAILGVVAAIFIDTFMAIYYYDIRVRKEGLDLQLAAAPDLGVVQPV